MRKTVMILTALLWSALLIQTWPSGGLTNPDEAASVGLFVMLLMAVGMATLASFPRFATGAYLVAAIAACFFGPFGLGILPFYYGLGLLFLTLLTFRHWRSHRVATVDVPVLVDPSSGRQYGMKPRRRKQAPPPRRYGKALAWSVVVVVTLVLVRFAEPSLPTIEAVPLGAILTGAGLEAGTTSAPASPEIVAYVDEVFWRILAVEGIGQTPVGAASLAAFYPADSQHVRVRVEIENSSDVTRTYTGFKLVDSQENVTGRSLTSLLFVPESERCVIRVLQPGKASLCTEIFRVNQNAAGLQALVNDLQLFGERQESEVALGIPVSAGPLVNSQLQEEGTAFLDRVLGAESTADLLEVLLGTAREDDSGPLDPLLNIVAPPVQPRVNSAANLRSGPGTEYAVVGSAAAGDILDLAGKNSTGEWYHLRSGEWIAALLVEHAPYGLPTVQ